MILILLIAAVSISEVQSFVNGLPFVDEYYRSVELKNIFSLSNMDIYVELTYFLIIFFIASRLTDYGLDLFGIFDKEVQRAYPLTVIAVKIICFAIIEAFAKSLNFQKESLGNFVKTGTGDSVDARSLAVIGMVVITIILIVIQFRELVVIAAVIMMIALYKKKQQMAFFIIVCSSIFLFISKGIKTKYNFRN